MDLFDLGEGFSSLSEGVARIQCPTLVGTWQQVIEAFSSLFFLILLRKRTRSDFEKHLTIKNCDKTFLKIILRLKNC